LFGIVVPWDLSEDFTFDTDEGSMIQSRRLERQNKLAACLAERLKLGR